MYNIVVYPTTGVYQGNAMQSRSNADSLCVNDPNAPGGSSNLYQQYQCVAGFAMLAFPDEAPYNEAVIPGTGIWFSSVKPVYMVSSHCIDGRSELASSWGGLFYPNTLSTSVSECFPGVTAAWAGPYDPQYHGVGYSCNYWTGSNSAYLFNLNEVGSDWIYSPGLQFACTTARNLLCACLTPQYTVPPTPMPTAQPTSTAQPTFYHPPSGPTVPTPPTHGPTSAPDTSAPTWAPDTPPPTV